MSDILAATVNAAPAVTDVFPSGKSTGVGGWLKMTLGQLRNFARGGDGSTDRVSAPYWRIRCTSLNPANASGSPTFGLAEVAFKDAGGATISMAGGTAISSTINGGLVAANAFDSSAATAWYSANGRHIGEWIGFHYTGAVAVSSVTLTSDPGFPQGCARDFAVEFSANGTEWFTASTFYSAAWVAGVTQNFVLS